MDKNAAPRKKSRTYLVFAINALLIAVIIFSFFQYNTRMREELNEENLRNIENLNQSAANIASAYFTTRREKLNDAVLFITSNHLNEKQALEYIWESTSATSSYTLQLILPNFVGAIAEKDDNGNFQTVNYSHSSYAKLQPIFAAAGEMRGVFYTPEFTDHITGLRSFGLCSYVILENGTEEGQPCTVMITSKSSQVNEIVNPSGGYNDLYSVLIDTSGNYILSNNAFKATNLYDYFYSYNNLTLDERNSIARTLTSSRSGELYFRNSNEEECLFRYTSLTDNNWYCVTQVPLSSFHTAQNSTSFAVTIAIAMLAIFGADLSWLLVLIRKLRVSVEQERHANESKSEFLSRMSHDIRTPLNGIIGSTALAMYEVNPPQTQAYLQTIDSSSRFLLGLVNDILDMSRVENGKMALFPEPYSVEEIDTYLNAVIAPLAKDKGIVFSLDCNSEHNCTYMLDKLRFNQICFNLLSNSVKFTNKGGQVAFKLVCTPAEGNSEQLEITVSDTGVGMSREFQEHMFEAFAQENQHVSGATGTGLGLSIVNALVRLMDGSIAVQSERGKGTTFTVKLNARTATAVQESTTVQKDEWDESLKGKRVLVCEDNKTNLFIAIRLLDKMKITSETAMNGRIGVETFLASEAGHFDAILMDIMMPELDGLSACREIRASSHPQAATIPIIAMTANAYSSDVDNCTAAGMNDHIAKPVEPLLMFAALKRWLLKQ